MLRLLLVAPPLLRSPKPPTASFMHAIAVDVRHQCWIADGFLVSGHCHFVVVDRPVELELESTLRLEATVVLTFTCEVEL